VPSFVDLDQRPDLVGPVLALFQAAGPGRRHAICGTPVRMGKVPTAEDLADCLGTIVLVDGVRVIGALAICPYSEEQATYWGPVAASGVDATVTGRLLLREVRGALREGGFASVRALADLRNRDMRSFLLSNGFTVWKDSYCYERSLHRTPQMPEGIRPATKRDHAATAAILASAFPESGHCLPNLGEREREGYRHYVAVVGGIVVGAAAVQDAQHRSWIKLIALRPDLRRQGTGRALLAGILHLESALGHREIGLEVLADNTAAIAAFESVNFKRTCTFTILTGPV
jgi:ribosomal protein S18 acetylase RimI-like enzyme